VVLYLESGLGELCTGKLKAELLQRRLQKIVVLLTLNLVCNHGAEKDRDLE
jgi:hypothetical protein